MMLYYKNKAKLYFIRKGNVTRKKKAFDTISRVLAITRLDIEQHQVINDTSLNIHGENFFRDVFNFVYDCNFENANSVRINEPYIDLVDDANKKVIQITTTRTREKIELSLKVLKLQKYKMYEFYVFYLLDKAMPASSTKEELESIYNINLKDVLKDYRDLMRDINDLDEVKIIELSEKYFADKELRYTEEIVLDLVIKKLLKERSQIKVYYDDDLGSIDVNSKILVNSLNDRIANEIKRSLDFVCIINSIDDSGLISGLRNLVVDDFYKHILIEKLKFKFSKNELLEKKANELHMLALKENLDFSKLISLLVDKIECNIAVQDFNSMNIAWIIVAYFFEICDVGVKPNDFSK